ncbi:MAG: aspartate aminotransferase family protein [Chthonomonadales bacterium]|nr:aspartate aminotransferase family protein [Chthonomonadales bacterium]
MFERESLPLLREALEQMEEGFRALPGFTPAIDVAALRPVLAEAAARMRDNYPYAHPLYAGQMLKPPHPVARLAYALALWLNPNNHALDGGRASSAMEQEAAADIARMLGWEAHLGHLCGGGTMANLEALWVAREVSDTRGVAASAQAHYTHPRLCGVLGVPFTSVPTDPRGRMDPAALEAALRRGGIGTVVATLGTTAIGACDPLPEILALRDRHAFRLHVDAAYGGYFALASGLSPETRRAYDRLAEADSVVVDPHKHGLQPYGCGCVLFRDPAVGCVYKHDSPYTYFSSSELHLGEISLECSRAGASAVALWATQRLLPLAPGGAFARGLDRSLEAARALHARLRGDRRFLTTLGPELDIVVWGAAAGSASASSARARRVFEEAAREDLHLALVDLPADWFRGPWPMEWDRDTLTCLRSCLMKPEHLPWLDRLWAALDRAADRAAAA